MLNECGGCGQTDPSSLGDILFTPSHDTWGRLSWDELSPRDSSMESCLPEASLQPHSHQTLPESLLCAGTLLGLGREAAIKANQSLRAHGADSLVGGDNII